MINQEDLPPVDRGGHKEYKTISVHWINHIMTALVCIAMLIVYCNVKKAYDSIQEDIRLLQPTVMHDTLFMAAPKVYYCWQCNKELIGVSEKNHVACCRFSYSIVKNDLVGKKLEE